MLKLLGCIKSSTNKKVHSDELLYYTQKKISNKNLTLHKNEKRKNKLRPMLATERK